MTAQFARGPQSRLPSQPQNAPHAALLIDFDNVTMGIRSDLTKELKNLLNSDIIKGKVAVQRAYADWRRYPQYIVSLAENSVDLIFAPAYGSSKKNATDIRLAIDALELVFTRPEIGTFILLSGDSDFSSLVLKLKEYGKYVIGVGIRESSSDLLVQNCDEYYSYSGLTGLTRASDETPRENLDPWELVEMAVRQMVEQRDVMRSDRLKQILLELDPNFSEKTLGFPKFNKFLQEAASRGLIQLRKMENGQFEVGPVQPALPAGVADFELGDGGQVARTPPPVGQEARPRAEPRKEPRPPRQEPAREARPEARPEPRAEPRPTARPETRTEVEPLAAEALPVPPEPIVEPAARESAGDLNEAYQLLVRATSDVGRGRNGAIRDSDVKRRMLELQPGFDEGAYGFSKFSRFLRQAHAAEVINMNKLENGSCEITIGPRASAFRLPSRSEAPALDTNVEPGAARRDERAGRRSRRNGDRRRGDGRESKTAAAAPEPTATPEEVPPAISGAAPPAPEKPPEAAPVVSSVAPPAPRPPERAPASAASAAVSKQPISLGFRRGSRGGLTPAAPPPILAGQTVGGAIQTPPSATPRQAPADSNLTTEKRTTERKRAARKASPRKAAEPVQAATDQVTLALDQLGLPQDDAQVVDRLASYKGVGRKSAEATVQAFGAADVFRVLHEQPERVRQTLGGRRADQLLKGWQQDLQSLLRPARKSRSKADQLEAFADGTSSRARKRKSGPRRPARKKSGAGK